MYFRIFQSRFSCSIKHLSRWLPPLSKNVLVRNCHSSACPQYPNEPRICEHFQKYLTPLLHQPKAPRSTHLSTHHPLSRQLSTMAKREAHFPLPESVRGMKVLDRTAFTSKIQVPALYVPREKLYRTVKILKKYMLRRPGIDQIQEPADGDPRRESCKLFLFDPARFQSIDDFPEEVRQFLCEIGVNSDFEMKEYDMTYENWTYDEILSAILPPDESAIGGYSKIGHILHLNLRDHQIEYKSLIGEVLLDKIKAAKTVVNKLNIIDNTFRNFAMEVLAGEENFITICKENGFQFEMDFSKVYWNPRLGTEHERVVSKLQPQDVVYDVFAGIGPFSVPAAKKKCQVLANDLNPDSYKWLKHNMKLNKVKVQTQEFNLDGREFVRQVVKPDLMKRWQQANSGYQVHIIMNLPAMAVEFLDVFSGLFSPEDISSCTNVVCPKVHCYCFCKGQEELDVEARHMAEQHLGHALPEGAAVRFVRNVAPYKDMMCVEFVLDESILTSKAASQDQEPPEKRSKHQSEGDT